MLESGGSILNRDRDTQNTNRNCASGDDRAFNAIHNESLSVSKRYGDYTWVYTEFSLLVYLVLAMSVFVPEAESGKPARDCLDIFTATILSARVTCSKSEVVVS